MKENKMNLNSLKNIKPADFTKILVEIKNNFDKDAGLFLVVLVIIVFFGVKQFVMPAVTQFSELSTKLSAKMVELNGFRERDMTSGIQNNNKPKQKLPINIYKAPYPGMDTETASAELVQEIIRIIKNTGNSKITTIDFTSQQVKDDAGTNSSDYGILSLNLSIESPYDAVQEILNEIYLMNYLVIIKNLRSEPLEKTGAELVNTSMELDLFIKLNLAVDNEQQYDEIEEDKKANKYN